MPNDPELRSHQEWLGFVQPVGLVVSAPALIAAQAYVNRDILATHQRFLEHVKEVAVFGQDDPIAAVTDLPKFLREVFGWEPGDLVEATDPKLEVALPEYHDTLRPAFAVPFSGKPGWQMLVDVLPAGTPLDKFAHDDERRWQASPQARFERLLRETQVPIGLLFNQTDLRLVYAPRGESSGFVTFRVADMAQVSGRAIFAALHMLLCAERLFDGPIPEKQRLPAILAESRKYQSNVSTQLAEQVLAALYHLLRGFQAADDQAKGKLLRDVLNADPNQVYAGLLNVLMRLVFLLYAEDRGLLSTDPVYVKHYSVTGLFERLRADAGRYPDTMDQRFGAWAQLLSLFRIVHEGANCGAFRLPARHGHLFDPEKFPFLAAVPSQAGEDIVQIPHVADGVVYRVLNNLLILDGERLSYRTLDVEQIGSVYEAVMGYRLEKATGRSIAIKPTKPHGAPVTINLEALLTEAGDKRAKWLKEQTDQALTGEAATRLKEAATVDDLLAALDKKIAKYATPDAVAKGSMILQPSDERRRSGSHYTPRSLTEPIVRKALEPILKQLGDSPKPEVLLDLKVCDPAMGSGAFLVEVCRQLGSELVKAWRLHDCVPKIPPDEDELLHAQRIIAQRCLYGVDKNPMAVNLAKLSLWLATLAKDHPFTFLDHVLRCGDSLVGLTREQIAEFNWKQSGQRAIVQEHIEKRIEAATAYRKEILDSAEDNVAAILKKRERLALAEESLNTVRFIGNLAIAAFFAEDKNNKRESKRQQLLGELTEYLTTGNMKVRPTKAVEELKAGEKGVSPFHWEIEFPEVFGRENPGFDVFVGNPPFLGGKDIAKVLDDAYLECVKTLVCSNKGSLDLAAYFLHRMSQLIREHGAFGLIATMALIKGGTREGGLLSLIEKEYWIASATTPREWPGAAAVHFVTVVITKGLFWRYATLDGKPVTRINSHLKPRNEPKAPIVLKPAMVWSRGTTFLGEGFMLSPEERDQLIVDDPQSAEVIRKLLGGTDLVQNPTGESTRYVIDFGEMSENEAKRFRSAYGRVFETVKPQRDKLTRQIHEECFWKHWDKRNELYAAVRSLPRAIAFSMVTKYVVYNIVEPPNEIVFSDRIGVIANPTLSLFAIMQSRVNECWVIEYSNRRGETLQISISDSLGTFPFLTHFEKDHNLEAIGRDYFTRRKIISTTHGEGLTDLYNRFHDPNERDADILKLRQLHDAMDRAVLTAYGGDLGKLTVPACQFLLDYEEEDEEDETPGTRRRKKPWRYRWPDEFRDEVLALLLDLNRVRAEEEKLAGAGAEKPKKTGAAKKRAQKKGVTDGPGMF